MKKVKIYDEERTQVESIKEFEECDNFQWFNIYVSVLSYPEGTNYRFVGSVNKHDISDIRITTDGDIHSINGVFFRNGSIIVLG